MREFGKCLLRFGLAFGKRQRLPAAKAQVTAPVADPGRTRQQFLEAARLGEQPVEILRPLVRVRPDDERQVGHRRDGDRFERSEEHTSELQSLMRISYAVFCLKKKKNKPSTLINLSLTTKNTITNLTYYPHLD